MIASTIAACVIVFISGVLIGFSTASRAYARAELRSLGFNRQSADLYRRAAKFPARLVRVTELYGDFAADTLSTQTRAVIEQWLNDYEKEIS